MIIPAGSKILVCHRRLFHDDSPRYFLGVANAYENGMASVTGFTWIRDQINGKFQKRTDSRTKVMSLSSGTLICYILPDEVDVEVAEFLQNGNKIWLKDLASGFCMELTEGIYPKDTPRKPVANRSVG